MNIILPLGGKGERFLNEGYKDPKPLIKIFEKPMIFYVLDNLNLKEEDNIFIIYYNIKKELFENTIKEKYKQIYFIELKEQTTGASETLYKGLPEILKYTKHKKTMLFDCDTFYTEDVISMYRGMNTNAVFYILNTDTKPIFSYINTDEKNNIIEIAEKKKISDKANTGIYCFNDIQKLYNYAESVIINHITFQNECYTSCIIDQMIKENVNFLGIELNEQFVFHLGTPKQVNDYIDKTFFFLFDLDGTLIISEDIYFEIWKNILIEYSVELTSDMFKKNISGNNDLTVLQKLIPNSNVSVNYISKKKDELFIQNINKVNLINGVKEMLTIIKKNGHKMAIVTNCNRQVTECILDHFKIYDYFDTIIIGNECKYPKPYSDPYKNAIQKLCGTNIKSIIFEDSKTGLLSANGVSPKCIIGIETLYNKEELLNNFANITMKDFIDFNLEDIINYDKIYNKLAVFIKKSLPHLEIEKIEFGNDKLKGGFISDVLDLKVKTTFDNLHCVLKIENKNDNFLTKMSNKLDLYNREYYFYEYLSKHIPVSIPKYYGLIKDNENNNIAILMENINNSKFKLNLNLNNENLSVSLKVIESIALMHSKFWGKNLTRFSQLKKNNDSKFSPFWNDFILSKWEIFQTKWKYTLTKEQFIIGENIVKNFSNIQQKLSNKNLTLCHGDVKSANIFYKIINSNDYEPYFIDWQYIILGKGVQDLVFFMIESFEINKMKYYKHLFKEYYYVKLIEYGIITYDKSDYEEDFINASYYFPFFVAIWFGTMNEDELIDKNFPIEFIKKLFHFYTLR
jgi:beta-phosphoglucomutase-like phosphatase (HAD superfamily)/choline kinase